MNLNNEWDVQWLIQKCDQCLVNKTLFYERFGNSFPYVRQTKFAILGIKNNIWDNINGL